MRVTAGLLRGRIFKSPRTRRTHPMSDKMRSAMFNVLGDITELRVLDAFSGSGAIAFESVSRGAKLAVAVERDSTAYAQLMQNIAELQIESQVRAVRANVSSWSNTNRRVRFDIVVCDPPYNHVQLATIKKLARHVADNGTLIVSLPADAEQLDIVGMKRVKQQSYAGGSLSFYKPA